MVLTHAHLDHSGYLPLLVKNGFRGKILCSGATFDLCKILLPDSGRLLEEEAGHANRHAYSRHAPALPPAAPAALLGQTIRETAARGGVTIIPAFAVGRAQSILYAIDQLKRQGAIPSELPVYLNSPMATDATAPYQKHLGLHRLDRHLCAAMRHAAHIVNSVEESIALNQRQIPMVIISASGRVLHHLKAFAGDRRNTVLFAGFQAGGTRGAATPTSSPPSIWCTTG